MGDEEMGCSRCSVGSVKCRQPRNNTHRQGKGFRRILHKGVFIFDSYLEDVVGTEV